MGSPLVFSSSPSHLNHPYNPADQPKRQEPMKTLKKKKKKKKKNPESKIPKPKPKPKEKAKNEGKKEKRKEKKRRGETKKVRGESTLRRCCPCPRERDPCRHQLSHT